MDWVERLQQGSMPLEIPDNLRGKWVALALTEERHIPLVLLWLSGELAKDEGRDEVTYDLKGVSVTIKLQDIVRLLTSGCSGQVLVELVIGGVAQQVWATLECERPSSDTSI
ncbi:hypothetical protein HPY42_01140 [Coprothermobacteraceae bacterium]|nr:hypothetical protein [Coprothermobacteraceae bacterium]